MDGQCQVPTQHKAIQLAVALAVWATQRSNPDFTFTGSEFPRLPLDNDDVAIVKKRKKLNKERKERLGKRVVLENDLTQK
jgi:hypothetical protein